MTVQPIGGNTLVTLPVYYEVGFTKDGVAPNETFTIPPDRMLGLNVAVRPRTLGYRYIFGDGTATELTTDAGGPYPTGRITHPYGVPGYYQASVEVLYSADISIEGGPFLPIDQTVTISGAPTTITVKTSHNMLIGNNYTPPR